MEAKSILFLLVNILLSQSINGQIIPLGGGGCGCQQLPVQQNVPINNCGCNGNLQLANVPNGIIANNFQLAKHMQANVPCGCVPNNLQLSNNCNCNMQNLQLANLGHGLQITNGLQMANLPLTQNELLALVNGISAPNYQSVLQLSMQALLNQLGNNLPVNCPCGCQSNLAQGLGINANNLNILKAFNNMQMGVQSPACSCSNVPMLNNMNGMPLAGTQDIVLNNSPGPCQSCANPNTMSFTVYH